MVAFGAFELVKSMQEQLGAIDSVYGTYLMYWVLSLSDGNSKWHHDIGEW
jgi:hypothetical protein